MDVPLWSEIMTSWLQKDALCRYSVLVFQHNLAKKRKQRFPRVHQSDSMNLATAFHGSALQRNAVTCLPLPRAWGRSRQLRRVSRASQGHGETIGLVTGVQRPAGRTLHRWFFLPGQLCDADVPAPPVPIGDDCREAPGSRLSLSHHLYGQLVSLFSSRCSSPIGSCGYS